MASSKPVLPPTWQDVALTDEERAKIITAAVEAAQQARWQEIKTALYWWTVNNPPPPKVWTAEELYGEKMAEAGTMIARFRPHPGLDEVLWTMALYFTEDPRFEDLNEGYSLHKGLCLVGDVGRGKTTLMQLFSVNPRCRYRILSCREVAGAYAEGGADALVPYFNQSKGGACFDDLGIEPALSKYYGNDTNAMADVLLGRYESWQRSNLRGYQTHLTTNLPADEFTTRYGNRVRSRMRELFNWLPMPADLPDHRA
jgi:hypothetical protein